MAENDVQPSVSDDLVLARAFADLARDRRVLWIGRLTEGAEELAEEAKSVRLLGAPGDAASAMPAALRITAYRPGRLAFRPGSFDLAVVPDASWLGEEAPDRLAELATIVGDGLLVFSSDGPTEESYSRLRLLVERAKIEGARILGRTRFEGAAFAALDREPTDVVVDGELVGRRAVERYVVIAGPRADEVPALSLVGIPAARKSNPPPALEDMLAERSGEAARLRAELDASNDRASSLTEQLRTENARLRAGIERQKAESQRGSGDDSLAREVAELETKLADQARRTIELEEELARRSTLLRDVLETRGGGGVEAPEELVARLVAAEAAVVAARFENDELRARIPAQGDASGGARDDDERAALVGTVRGLSARLAEAEELHGLLEARLTLAHLDLEALRDRERKVERETEELRERFEVELVRTRGLSPAPSSEDLEATRAEITGLQLRLADREAALALAHERAAAPGDERVLAELRAQGDDLRASAGVREALVTRLQLDLARSERSGEDASRQLAGAKAESERLRGALVAASEAVDGREAMNARMGELERLAATARSLEKERDRALEALRDARSTLQAIDFRAGSRPPGAEITAVGMEAPRDDAAPSESTAALERELADRDTLLRSLTAQLEERNDRLRALERRLAGASVVTNEDTSALTQEIMELQERVVRLSEQLAKEREARRAVESQPPPRPDAASGDDTKRALDERDAALQRSTRRVGLLENDLQATRDAIGRVQQGLEELIGDSAIPMELADRLGKLLEELS